MSVCMSLELEPGSSDVLMVKHLLAVTLTFDLVQLFPELDLKYPNLLVKLGGAF